MNTPQTEAGVVSRACSHLTRNRHLVAGKVAEWAIFLRQLQICG
jgi:hypothetical protein